MEWWSPEGVRVANPLPDTWNVQVQSGSARSLAATFASFDNLLPVEKTVGMTRKYETGTYGTGTYGPVKRTVLDSLLQVAGTVVKVWWTIRTGTQVFEVKAGEFTVSSQSFELGEAEDDETLTLTAYDARRAIEKAGWTQAYKVAAGTNVWSAAVAIAVRALPGVKYRSAAFLGVTKTTAVRLWFGLGGTEDLDPWAAIVKLAGLAGRIPYIDADGYLTSAPIPALGSNPAPVWHFVEGDGGTIFSAGVSHDDEELVNTVVVTGSTTKKGLIYAVAQNNTAGDPYRVSRIGKRTLTINASGVDSTAEAQELADLNLRHQQGLTEKFTVDAVLLPWLEEFAVVKVTSEDLATDDLALLDSFTIHDGQDPGTGYNLTRRVA